MIGMRVRRVGELCLERASCPPLRLVRHAEEPPRRERSKSGFDTVALDGARQVSHIARDGI